MCRLFTNDCSSLHLPASSHIAALASGDRPMRERQSDAISSRTLSNRVSDWSRRWLRHRNQQPPLSSTFPRFYILSLPPFRIARPFRSSLLLVCLLLAFSIDFAPTCRESRLRAGTSEQYGATAADRRSNVHLGCPFRAGRFVFVCSPYWNALRPRCRRVAQFCVCDSFCRVMPPGLSVAFGHPRAKRRVGGMRIIRQQQQ